MTAPRLDGPAWAMLIVLSLVWGSSFPFTEFILREVPVLTTVALRVVIAAAVLWLAIAVTRAPLPRGWPIIGALALLAIFSNVVPFVLIVWAQTEITGGLAAVLNASTPIFTAVLAGIFLADEQLSPLRLAGLLIGLCGVAVVMGPAALTLGGSGVLPEIAMLTAALSYGGSSVFARRFSRLGVTPLTIAATQTALASLVLVPLALVVDRPLGLPMPGWDTWLAIAGFGCISTAFAYIIFFALLARAGASNVVLVTVLIPVVAVLLGASLLGETVTSRQLAGMVVIFAGLTVVDGRLWRSLGRQLVGGAAPPRSG